MASSNVNLESTAAEAAQTFGSAVTAVGGTIFSTIPGQPIRFRLTRKCNPWIQGMKSLPYDGSARISQAGPNQTRIDIDVTPAPSYFLMLGGMGIAVFVLNAMGYSMGYSILSPFIWLIILIGVFAYSIYQATSWAPEVLEPLLVKLSGAPAPR